MACVGKTLLVRLKSHGTLRSPFPRLKFNMLEAPDLEHWAQSIILSSAQDSSNNKNSHADWAMLNDQSRTICKGASVSTQL